MNSNSKSRRGQWRRVGVMLAGALAALFTLAGTLVAHLTPGHTKGCTTWTMKVDEAGKTYDVVIVGSPNVNEGYRLVGKPSYPKIESDYEQTFRVLKSLPVVADREKAFRAELAKQKRDLRLN